MSEAPTARAFRRTRTDADALGTTLSRPRRTTTRPLPLRSAPVLALLVFLACGCVEEKDAFRFVELDPAGRPLARNEAIVLTFSAEPAAEMARSPLVRVVDDGGRDVPVSLRVTGRSLVVRPGSSWQWPESSRLSIFLRRGFAVSFHDVDGRALKDELELEVALGRGHRDFGAAFRVEEVSRPAGPMVGPGESFVLRLSLPVDPAALPDAIGVLGPDGVRRGCEVALRDEGRELVVTPWPAGGTLAPGAPHRLFVGPTLRALTGRPIEGAFEEAFWTTPVDAEEGFLDVSFALADLASAGDDGARGWARPRFSPLNAVVLNGDYTHLGRADRTTFGEPWSRWPSRVQVLLPGSRLGSEPGLITGFAFFVVGAPARKLVFPRLVFRIGRAGAAGLVERLDDAFARRRDGSGWIETVARGSGLGEWTPDAEAWERLHEDQGQGWLAIDFERPFYYAGDGADLVLEIRNELGCFPAAPDQPFPAEFTGLRWAGGSPDDQDDAPYTRVVARARSEGHEELGQPDRARLATKIRVDRYRDYVTPWIPVDAEDPDFFVLPTADHLDADGVEGVDFRFEFQGRRADGETPWGRLEALRGSRNIRVRLAFPPSSGRSADQKVEVRGLRIRYHDRGAARPYTPRGSDR